MKLLNYRMKVKPTRGRKSIQMLHDLANDGGFVALKRAAEDREVQRKDVKNLLYSRRLLMMMMKELHKNHDMMMMAHPSGDCFKWQMARRYYCKYFF